MPTVSFDTYTHTYIHTHTYFVKILHTLVFILLLIHNYFVGMKP